MDFIFLIVALLLAIDFHEATHAYVAYKFGDPTAKVAGRMSLNPLVHLDPIGTLALILVHFGWGKPVPVDIRNLNHPSRDNFLIAISGPISNLFLAAIAGLLIRLTGTGGLLFNFLGIFAILNVFLAVFNLIPIPPLDGSKIWHLFLSDESYFTLERMGPIILLAFILFAYTSSFNVFGYIQSGAAVVSHILGIPPSVI